MSKMFVNGGSIRKPNSDVGCLENPVNQDNGSVCLDMSVQGVLVHLSTPREAYESIEDPMEVGKF